MESLKKFYYYLFLFIKKSRIFLHNSFELPVKSTDHISPEQIKILLWKNLIENIRFDKYGAYFRTKVTNKKSPMVLSQARVILILCNNSSEPKFKSLFLVKQLSNYLISMRGKNGLFKFNQSSWDLQDEGIASVWSALALIKAYELTEEKEYLDVATETIKSMLKNLYTKETSLIHTTGDVFWCLNSASTFAYVCALTLNHFNSDEIKIAMVDSINLCLDKIAEDGHYPYNLKRQGTYLLLYHPIVMITLNNCLRSEFLDFKTRTRIINTNKKAANFLLNSLDDKERIFEPEIKHYKQYIISNITSLVALKEDLSIKRQISILQNIAGYFVNSKLFLCKNEEDRLYNSDLYSVKDVLAIEVLYWLDLYQKNSQ